MGSTLTYSTVALRASFTIPPPYLSPTSLPVSSVPSYHNKGENDNNKNNIYIYILMQYTKYLENKSLFLERNLYLIFVITM